MKNNILITSFIVLFASLANYAQAQSCQNCGLGTNIPHARLEIRGCTDDSTTGALKLTNSKDTTTTPLMYVGDNHRVGIGLDNPSQALEVHGIIYSNTGGIKYPDGTIQTSASGITMSTGSSVVNNIGGGNTSTAPLSVIASGKNNSITGSADYGVILGGKNNAIESNNMNYVSSIPAPVNPGGHNFISSGELNTIKANANHAAIIGGRNNTIGTGAANSVILGGNNITATEPNTVYMQKAAVTDLALSGSGYRTVLVDSMGKFRASTTPEPPGSNIWSGTPWTTTGNQVSAISSNNLGTRTPVDLVIITNNKERMRITQDGFVGIGTVPNIIPSSRYTNPTVDPNPQYKLDILGGNLRVLSMDGSSTNNIVIKTQDDLGDGAAECKIGIGTEDPIRALHIVTRHLMMAPPPPPNCLTCLSGPHNGLRLEDYYKPGNVPVIRTIWDIAPEYNATAKSGMLVLGIGDPSNAYTLDGKMVLLNNGNVGIGTANPKALLEVSGSISVFDGNNNGNTSLFFGREHVSAGILGEWGIHYGDGGLNFWKPSGSNGTTAGNGFGNYFLFLKDDGKVGIGVDPSRMTTNNVDALGNKIEYKLYVAKGIMTERCRVALQKLKDGSPNSDWGDWVFEKNNKRMTFEEQLKYYSKNKHLNGIPSGNELKENGIDVSEMFTGVVINLEEARLDAIQLHNENQNQKDEINELKELAKQQQKEMRDLKNELEKLKRK